MDVAAYVGTSALTSTLCAGSETGPGGAAPAFQLVREWNDAPSPWQVLHSTAGGPEAIGKRSCVAGVGAVLAGAFASFWHAMARSARRHAPAWPAAASATLPLTIVWSTGFLASSSGVGSLLFLKQRSAKHQGVYVRGGM